MLGTACAAVDFLSGGKRGEVEGAERKVARAIGMEIGALKSWRKAFKRRDKGADGAQGLQRNEAHV